MKTYIQYRKIKAYLLSKGIAYNTAVELALAYIAEQKRGSSL
jgi:hypothetical protein